MINKNKFINTIVTGVFMMMSVTMLQAAIPKKTIPPKSQKSKTFINQFEYLLNNLKTNSFLKDPFESKAEYEARLSKIKLDEKLAFEEYFDIDLKYDPEEGNLVFSDKEYKNKFYKSESGLLMMYRFRNCDQSEDVSIKLSNKKYITLQGCKVSGYDHSLLNGSSGFGKSIDMSSEKYEATNGLGQKVVVSELDGVLILMSPIDDTIYESIQNIKIPSNKEYAKSNLHMKLALKGKIINPSEIETGVTYHKATFQNPTEMTRNLLGAKVNIEKASLIDAQGKEIAIDFRKEERRQAEENSTYGAITNGHECEAIGKQWIWNGSINKWQCKE